MRRPVQLEMAGGKTPRQRIWDAIRLARTGFTLADIETATRVNPDTIRTYLIGLEKANYLASHQFFPGYRKNYTLMRDVGVEAPRVKRDGTPVIMGAAQEQMWRTLNMQAGDCNACEMAAHASTQAVPVREVAAADYLRMLHKAGYLQMTVVGKGVGKGGLASRYRLLPAMRTGPRPPMVCRCDAVYDANLGKVVWSNAEEKVDV